MVERKIMQKKNQEEKGNMSYLIMFWSCSQEALFTNPVLDSSYTDMASRLHFIAIYRLK